MRVELASARLSGAVDAPPSKSHTQRVVAAACLARGTTVIERPSDCDDSAAALGIARALGCAVARDGDTVRVTGSWDGAGFRLASGDLDCGESALCARLFAPIASLARSPIRLVGRDSLRARPMDMLVAPLRALGVSCETEGGRLPVTVRGPLSGGVAEVDCAVSSQHASGLLLALPLARPLAARDSALVVTRLASAPYLDLTCAVAEAFGARIGGDRRTRFEIRGGLVYEARRVRVEGDWSSGAVLLVAGAIAADPTAGILVRGLDPRSTQADRLVLEALRAAGARVDEEAVGYRVRASALRAFDLDLTDAPDLFPPLAALAARADGTSVLHGVRRLAHKESDRAAAIIEEFAKLGASVERSADELRIRGGRVSGGAASSRGDHRIAMALALLSLAADQPVTIDDAECVNKSYPTFWEDLRLLSLPVSR